MASTMVREAIRIERVKSNIGARVHGVDLNGEHSAETADILRYALHEHGVLLFQFDRMLTADEFNHFAPLFGTLEGRYALSSADKVEAYMDSGKVPMQEHGIDRWHSDGTALDLPPQAAILTPVELPEIGGDTMWASMYAAWDALSPRYQQLLDGLEVVHGTTRMPFLKQSPSATHPAVIRDPVTGRKALFVNSNYSERIIGLTDRENESVLRMLFEHVNSPEFHIRVEWKPGLVVVWEERVTQHRGVADFNGPRKMRRLTFTGEKPTA